MGDQRKKRESALEFALARAFISCLALPGSWLPTVDHQAAATIKHGRAKAVQLGHLLSLSWAFLTLEMERKGSRWRVTPGERQFLSLKDFF